MTASAIPPASPAPPPSIEELLDRLLNPAGAGDRAKALLDAINAGVAGVTVADYRCGGQGDPIVFTFRQLCRHVFDTDGPRDVEARGYRLHTPVNVVAWHEELGGHGPGLGRGPN